MSERGGRQKGYRRKEGWRRDREPGRGKERTKDGRGEKRIDKKGKGRGEAELEGEERWEKRKRKKKDGGGKGDRRKQEGEG